MGLTILLIFVNFIYPQWLRAKREVNMINFDVLKDTFDAQIKNSLTYEILKESKKIWQKTLLKKK